jgi:nicotinamidase/pyrazinamidase
MRYRIDARHDALVVVDVQNDFCPGGSLAVPDGDSVVPVLNRYAERFDAQGAAVFASRDWHPPRTKHFAAYGGIWPPHCVQGTPGAEFHPALRLPPSAIVVSSGMAEDEDGYSAFDARDEQRRLRVTAGRARDPASLRRGLATDYCVKATALDALRAGLTVVVLQDAVRAVDVTPGVVDLGCGFGWFCRWAREAGAAQVLGLDVSEKMLARARETTSDRAVTYRQADLETLDLPTEAFDLVYSSLTLHYIEKLPALLATVRHALVPGGHLVFSAEHPIYTAPAEALPFRDSVFDTVVSGLVLCSVSDPVRALAEARRVLRPDGELRALEHVRSRHPWRARVQDAIQPAWTWFAGGCHPSHGRGAGRGRRVRHRLRGAARRGNMRRFAARVAARKSTGTMGS